MQSICKSQPFLRLEEEHAVGLHASSFHFTRSTKFDCSVSQSQCGRSSGLQIRIQRRTGVRNLLEKEDRCHTYILPSETLISYFKREWSHVQKVKLCCQNVVWCLITFKAKLTDNCSRKGVSHEIVQYLPTSVTITL